MSFYRHACGDGGCFPQDALRLRALYGEGFGVVSVQSGEGSGGSRGEARRRFGEGEEAARVLVAEGEAHHCGSGASSTGFQEIRSLRHLTSSKSTFRLRHER